MVTDMDDGSPKSATESDAARKLEEEMAAAKQEELERQKKEKEMHAAQAQLLQKEIDNMVKSMLDGDSNDTKVLSPNASKNSKKAPSKKASSRSNGSRSQISKTSESFNS